MRQSPKKLCFAASMLIVVCAASKSTAAVDIKLRERIEPHASVVRLGDVAEIVTTDRQQARQLATLPLMPAPAPGTERFLRTREIQDMLAAQGVDLGDLHFAGAERVVVAAADGSGTSVSGVSGRGEAQSNDRVTPPTQHAAILAGATTVVAQAPKQIDEARAADIRQQITSVVVNYLKVKTGKVEPWKVECDLGDHELGRLNAAVSPPNCTGGSEPWIGRQRFLISFTTADGPLQLPIFAEVSPPPVPAIVAIRPIGAATWSRQPTSNCN